MSPLAARRRRGLDFWPGFVDALSALLLVLVFLLLVFAVGQFVLSDALSGRERALDRLRADLSELSRQLALESSAKTAALARNQELETALANLRAERERLGLELADTQALAQRLGGELGVLQEQRQKLEAEAAQRAAELAATREKLDLESARAASATTQISQLNRELEALRRQLAELTAALGLERERVSASERTIAELRRELDLALAKKVSELERYRSDFFGRLREILGQRPDVVIVGDRFVIPAELLFPSGSDELSPEARAALDRLAATLREVTAEIPSNLDWVLRIDGHTDRRPIHTPRFPSNWELSTARAVAIVKYLVTAGIPPKRLAATGFGEFHPLDPGSDEAALARNRRIEIQLTNR